MATDELSPTSLNIAGVTDLVQSKTNKLSRGAGNDEEGATGEKIDILELDMEDDELIKLAKKWVINYEQYYGKIKPRQEKNKKYYLGQQQENIGTDGTPIAGNLLFEAEETFLPAALSKNPEPVVYSDDTEEGNKLSDDIKTMLRYHADVLVLRRKLALMTRQWSIYFLGVLKHGWDEDISDIKTDLRRIQDFIFDPNGYVDVYGDFIGYLGEKITVSAEELIEMFPKKETYIRLQVENKLGTDCTYTEWWTDEYCFYTFKDEVLDKHKNQFFKYQESDLEEEPNQNHFAKPKKPYTFLSVFSLQEQPHDITGLIEQNISNQNMVSRETNQIDYNISRQNNSTAFSEDNFTQQTAKQAAEAMRKGHPLLVPAGRPINEAIVKFPAEGLSDAVFKNLQNNQENLRSIFGTQGISSQEPNENTTARGMILNQQYDNTRIGGGIGEALEQVADNVFNWWLQLYYVYYDQKHFAAVMGNLKGVEYVILSKQDLNRKLIVSTAPDSLKPKDEITEINQAVEFFQMGAIGPKTLLTIANFPDPDESASDGVLWKIDPASYMQLNWPDLAQKLQAMQAQKQQLEMQAQQQELQLQGAQGAQKLQQGEQAHQQKLRHGEELHAQKVAQQPPAKPTTLAAEPASAGLANVKLPK